MDWGLLAGGVSKGLEGALAGANQGLLQGEQIRHQRAQEGMQQQHFGLQQQQLQRLMAQQDFQNRMAQQQFGLRQEDLARQREYQRGMLGVHAGQLEETARGHDITQRHYEQMAPWYQSRANYYANPASRQTGMMKDLEGLAQARTGKSYLELEPGSPEQKAVEEEYHRTKNPLLQERRDRYTDLHKHTQLLDERLRLLNATPTLLPEERLILNRAQMLKSMTEAAMFRISRAAADQRPPDPRDVQFIEQNPVENALRDITNLENVVARRSAGQRFPGQAMPGDNAANGIDDFRRKHGYGPRPPTQR